MVASWVIIGCGYTGMYLARALLGRSAKLTVTRRDEAAVAELGRQLGDGVRAVRADLGEPSSLVGLVDDGAIVVCLAPPGDQPAREITNLLEASQRASRLVYVSSTGVYGRGGGDWVDESWPVAPITRSGQARAEAEAALARSSIPWVSLRAAGIHGPGRKMIDRIRAGTHRVVGDGTTYVSRIHVTDLVAAIIAAGDRPAVTGFVNVADDDPSPIGIVADAIAAHLGVRASPRVPVEAVTPEAAGMLTADRRIANRRMKDELGVELRFPSWRTGL